MRRPVVIGLFGVAATAWLVTLAFDWHRTHGLRGIALADVTTAEVTTLISAASAPLALLALLWLLMLRTSRGEESRYARTVASLRRESDRLETLLSFVSDRLDSGRISLSAQSDQLLHLGEDATARLGAISAAMRGEIETIDRHAHSLKSSAAAARGDMAVLLATLPKAQTQTRQMVKDLNDTGMAALERTGALDIQLSLLKARGLEANDIAGNAAQRLASHLVRIEGVSEVAGARLEQAADQMTGAVDTALDRAAAALDVAREGMAAQGAAVMAMVEQNQAALASAGAQSAETIGRRVDEIRGEINHIAASFAKQESASERLVARLHSDLESIEGRFAALDANGVARTERLGSAIVALRDHAGDLTTALQSGGDTANTLVDRIGSLMTALDAAAHEIDTTLPAAFTRLETKAQASMAIAREAAPLLIEVSEVAALALANLAENDATLARQREAISSIGTLSRDQMATAQATTDELAHSIAAATQAAHDLAAHAGPALIESLVRVRETANQATQHVKTAFGEIITQSTQTLGTSARDALADALTIEVETHMAAIAQTTETAVASAQKATDRLMRQMLTISETSAALEARITETKADLDRSDEGNFARRVALLIESLNSTAIDVTKIFSNDITDVAWAAYLRGDRGIFTRRAVRLLDASQAREITRNYEADTEFRAQVNRYIHDFESMLRNILATRDGSALGVTLLSSDNGKLYVALAQAIERLRN